MQTLLCKNVFPMQCVKMDFTDPTVHKSAAVVNLKPSAIILRESAMMAVTKTGTDPNAIVLICLMMFVTRIVLNSNKKYDKMLKQLNK